jgi:hypothetical protein
MKIRCRETLHLFFRNYSLQVAGRASWFLDYLYARAHRSIGVGDPVHQVADNADRGIGLMSGASMIYLVAAAAQLRSEAAGRLGCSFIVWPPVSTARCVVSISSWQPVTADANASTTTLNFSPTHPLYWVRQRLYMPHGVAGHVAPTRVTLRVLSVHRELLPHRSHQRGNQNPPLDRLVARVRKKAASSRVPEAPGGSSADVAPPKFPDRPRAKASAWQRPY